MSAKKIVIQQKLERSEEYQELWPKTDCYTKTETDSMIQPLQKQVESANWQIGDVRSTVKNDLSDDWILCDGSIVNGITYPGLLNYLSDSGSSLVEKTPVVSYTLPKSYNTTSPCVFKCNNLYMICTYKEYNNDPTGFWVNYSSDLINWQSISITQDVYYSSSGTLRIEYLNGFYILEIPGSCYFYSSELQSGEWLSLTTPTKNGEPLSIIYVNGKWVLFYRVYVSGGSDDDSTNTFYIATSSSNAPTDFSDYSSYTWTQIDYSTSGGYPYYYANSLSYWNRNYYFSKWGSICETADFLTSSTYTIWTQGYPVSSSGTGSPLITSIIRTNSYWVSIRFFDESKSSTNYATFYYYVSDKAEMNQETITDMGKHYYKIFQYTDSSTSRNGYLSDIHFSILRIIDDIIVCFAANKIYLINLDYKSVSEYAVSGAVFDNSYNGYIFKSTTQATPAEIMPSTVTVPTITSVGNVNYYIKGKESN